MTTITIRKTLSLAAVFVIVSSALIILDRRDALDPVREGLSSVVSPVARGFNRIAEGPDFRTDLERELDQVRAERDAARAENANLIARIEAYEMHAERERVEAERPELSFVSARVTGSDPTGNQKFITIDKGSEDGIEVGMAVTDPDYFVGQVVDVTDHGAKVMFIIDTSAQVGAQLMESRADGIVVGQWQAAGRMVMQNVDRDVEVNDGDVVVTSGSVATETRGVPPDIIIGTVFGDPIPTQRTNEVSYELRPAVDFDRLYTVWVVMPNDE